MASSPVAAQTEANSEGTDIVVTAQRRSERLQDVPITMTTLGADQLKQAGVEGLADIAKLTPALRFDNQGGFAQPTLRGVGNALTTSGSGSNVGIYVDGFYSPNPLQADFQLLNVEGVQVLKGPQGTLFGRNTTGGAILVTTSKPSFESSIIAEASYGSFDTKRFQAYATAPISSNIAIDIAGIYRETDGYLRNITTNDKNAARGHNWSVRAGLRWEPSDEVSFLFRYVHNKADDPVSVATNAYVLNGQPQSAAFLYGAPVATRPREVAYTSLNLFRSQADAFQLTSEFDAGFAKLTSYTQYRYETAFTAEDFDASPIKLFDISFGNRDKIFTQEFVLTSKPGGNLQWTAGLFYFYDRNTFDDIEGSVQGSPYALIGASGTTTESIAAFADVTYEIADRLFLTSGIRFSHDVVRDGFYYAGPLGVAFGNSPAIGRTNVPTLKDDRFTPRIVLRFAPDSRSSVFASYAKGYKAGILNVGGFTSEPVPPEQIDAFEVGYKYVTRMLSVDFSAYYYDYKNLQLSSFDGTRSIVTSANSRIWGIEGQIRYEPIPGLTLSAAAAYLNTKYKDYTDAPYSQQCTDPLTCGSQFGLYPSLTTNASGLQMLRSPKFTGNAGLGYKWAFAGGELGLSANVTYSSKLYFDAANQFSQKSYEQVSLRAEWVDPSDHFTLAIFGENITGSKYRTQVLPGQFAILQTWGSPATIGGSIRFKY